jgi:methylated-DNA-protein-cysteine methyltransferase related protein
MKKQSKNQRKKTLKKEPDNFFERVYDVVCRIPAGRVTTYGAIARYIGSPQSSRMVGWAMNSSHLQSDHIPAHRVVNRNGMLTGKHHFRHELLMQELLESEGIRVEDDRIVSFDQHFWDPYKELI